MIKLHWQFIAAKERKEGVFHDFSEVIVLHYENEETALIVAKKIIERPIWHLKQVWECQNCELHDKHKRYIDKVNKFLNKHGV